ncbi:MAG: DUF1016 family protein [Anaerolineales bacterium]|nr:DUF1016 family protein [Anaerolineales bacterium]
MSSTSAYELALEKFRASLAVAQSREVTKRIIEDREIVYSRYQPVFELEKLPNLSEETFRSFLYFENNRHWGGLYRHASKLTVDMNLLRSTLSILVDDSRPLAKRYYEAVSGLRGLGKAVATAILHVNSPNEFGIWNNTSAVALKALNIWPQFKSGSHFGNKYEEINKLLLRLATDLEIDLWTLDALMWIVAPKNGAEPFSEEEIVFASQDQKFGLERHLHDFLFDNWDHTSLGKEWQLHTEAGDDDAGYEYPTDIGRIDLLAHHRTKPEWLIVELKRGQSSDETVGQVSRYMGWVRKNLAKKNEIVRGLIISQTADPSIYYSIEGLGVDTISVQTYELEFHLKPVRFNS